ncbi:MAG: aminopeptidase N [Rhodocyclaceae bacterium]|nr:aminopeptidase N [Rhodocyclaceae bacterium]
MTTAPTIHLQDYTPPPYLVDTVELDVDVRPGATIVTAVAACRRAPGTPPGAPLVLDGEDLETLEVALDDRALAAEDYAITAGRMTLRGLPERFRLRTVVRIDPDGNTRLSGFYRSKDGYFTQCEAEGFRRITWFQDRPDVMATYAVTLHADRKALPVLLANGNPAGAGKEANGRHWARWEDPFRKPSYLFAMVAGKLDGLHDRYATASGREVRLAIHVEPGKLDQCVHAMEALKKSMRWDEERFGLECDLDHYNIVAVGDFNMGAMENKGLNVFNTKYVLARADVATDTDFENIDRVVAHEYFHNWTGNRVTCRDWFQLSLKEGLTVFRDQEFGADLHDARIARIREVRGLRAAQFPEDAGPMAHPVRPGSYVEINNFYTATVYQKGAEVVRMIQTLIGREAFRRGMDEYFRRHDGQAVTCEDFVAAMSAASGFDFGQFMRWYRQPGTPRVEATGHYDAAARRYTLELAQSNPKATDGDPYCIPVRAALLDAAGAELPGTARTLLLTETTRCFHFEDVPAAPVPSLLRDFSAPVNLDFPYSDGELTLLLAHDADPFNAWEAGQRLATRLVLAGAADLAAGRAPRWPAGFAEAAGRLLDRQAEVGPAFVAEALTLPPEATLAEMMDVVDPEALHAARNGLRLHLARELEGPLRAVHAALAPAGPYAPAPAAAGRRALRNLCLAYLLELEKPDDRQLAFHQYRHADNMTDQFAALAALAQFHCTEREDALGDFYRRWHQEALVVDKWLAVQAGSRLTDTLATVRKLSRHQAFDLGNPNKVYALLRTFGANLPRFHAADGEGYAFLAEQIRELDGRNPQVAARLARCFDRWRRFDAGRQAHARRALEGLRDHPGLSRDVGEIVERALG